MPPSDSSGPSADIKYVVPPFNPNRYLGVALLLFGVAAFVGISFDANPKMTRGTGPIYQAIVATFAYAVAGFITLGGGFLVFHESWSAFDRSRRMFFRREGWIWARAAAEEIPLAWFNRVAAEPVARAAGQGAFDVFLEADSGARLYVAVKIEQRSDAVVKAADTATFLGMPLDDRSAGVPGAPLVGGELEASGPGAFLGPGGRRL